MNCIPKMINKEQFNSCINLVALKIPAKACTAYLKTFKDFLFERPRTRRIYNVDDDPASRMILLGDKVQDLELSALPEPLRAFNTQHGGKPFRYAFPLTYDQLGVDEILTRILPADISEIPSSFEQVGHLAHLNLREAVLPYRHLVGQVILDKNPRLRTVVNKTGTIETQFRTFPMEVLAGEEDFDVSVKESGCVFRFNFKEVYWNSRLSTEHQRLVDAISYACAPLQSLSTTTGEGVPLQQQPQEGGLGGISHADAEEDVCLMETQGDRKRKKKDSAATLAENVSDAHRSGKRTRVVVSAASLDRAPEPLPVVADMMGGVGPFGVPLAKTGHCRVFCNDLNPESYKYMLQNRDLNKCGGPDSLIVCSNMDGREFIWDLLRRRQAIDHAILNLPQSAPEFLDAFIGYSHRLTSQSVMTPGEDCSSSSSDSKRKKLPVIHVYAFSTQVADWRTASADIAGRCASVMKCNAAELGELSLIPAEGTKLREVIMARRLAGVSDTGEVDMYDGSCWGHMVRDVSPHKQMVCLSFRLPQSVAEANLPTDTKH